ncbi:symmetrical bis(5'-nucleosyl)-tetraphosphatase [Parahaliea mediterranea]|uniref:Bis(5'-nucleosyl)-tetraphosphatase, symmetrical n=1 Tax=Parahaliea mediterranea TaxID=651086 RepID=A0A939DGL5_9GAMM|nr:symmetrical bis(5'-nucleosyl)-tetraphosphatase [Parahaliea mediterranea]MBN7797796.1 symmetrical bis(5'-nucleosyl)-tetraphosphatase [Parahaliea mediterranea]
MSTYAVGDIQGCLQPLKRLLERVRFNPDRDQLWSVGDIVNRGPKCLKTLRFLYDRRDNLKLVLGNHDLHLLAVAAGARAPGKSDTLKEILAAPDRDKLLDWLLRHPLVYREGEYTMVHAGIPPMWSVADALARSREVEAALQGPASSAFFDNMYGNEPAIWSEDLGGGARLRVITNYFTRMRFCTPEGELDLTSKGPEPSSGKAVAPWFSHPRRKARNDRILFGHWASLEGKTNGDNVIGLDTGCVWGGSLSLYCLETQQWTRCRCKDGRAAA